jgi:hypothetical protein
MFRSRLLLAVTLLLAALPLAAKEDWLPVTAADLAFTDPGGAPAVILYLQDETNDEVSEESFYIRAKILTEEGKKYGDVELPYIKNLTRVDDIKARVIQPDGSISLFDGKVYDKVIVKSKTLKVQVKTFTLPSVRPGSIIEYRYKVRWDTMLLFGTTWRVQRDLPVKQAHFSLRPYKGRTMVPLRLTWVNIGLPDGVKPKQKDGNYSLDMTNVPPLPDERLAPPEDWIKMMVRFSYNDDDDIVLSPDEYWRRKSAAWHDSVEEFVGKHKLVDQEVARLLQPSDTPEAKLRKLYARAQQVRNLSYEREKTEKEAKRDKTKDNDNADDVLKHGYGSSSDIDKLFLALARSAGFQASYVRAAQRDERIFAKALLDTGQFDSVLILVTLPDRRLFLDPGTLFCPFGVLSWQDTGVTALTAAKNGGQFLTTTDPASSGAVTQRVATFRYVDGALEGTLRLKFFGMEALRWRLNEHEEDETARRKDLEDEVQGMLPTNAKVDLINSPAWETTDDILVADFKISIPGAFSRTGKRLLFPVGLFQAQDSHPFRHADRKLPVYYAYPYREFDDIIIELPPGLALEGAPEPKLSRTDFAGYQRKLAFADNKLHLERAFIIEGILFQLQHYPRLRAFYDGVRAGDEEALVLKGGAQ